MALSTRTKNSLRVAIGDRSAGNELVAAINGSTSEETPASPVVPVAVTFTANTPATYGTPAGTLTIADGTTPTVVELLKYCDELRGNIVSLQAVLHAQGITS